MNIHQQNTSPKMGRLEPIPAGTPGPAFGLPSGNHSRLTLRDLEGRPAVLVFYVADWHPVCTAQLRLYQDASREFERFGATVVGISADSPWSHEAFAHNEGLGLPLLSDQQPYGDVARAYGVAQGERALFVLDGTGTVSWSARFPAAVNPGMDGLLSALERLLGMSPARDSPCAS